MPPTSGRARARRLRTSGCVGGDQIAAHVCHPSPAPVSYHRSPPVDLPTRTRSDDGVQPATPDRRPRARSIEGHRGVGARGSRSRRARRPGPDATRARPPRTGRRPAFCLPGHLRPNDRSGGRGDRRGPVRGSAVGGQLGRRIRRAVPGRPCRLRDRSCDRTQAVAGRIAPRSGAESAAAGAAGHERPHQLRPPPGAPR